MPHPLYLAGDLGQTDEIRKSSQKVVLGRFGLRLGLVLHNIGKEPIVSAK